MQDLLFIDTLQKVREVGGDKFSYASDYDIVTKLKAFSDECAVTKAECQYGTLICRLQNLLPERTWTRRQNDKTDLCKRVA